MTPLAALQAALAAEHATLYGYGVAGAHLTGAQRTQADTAYAGHLARRDDLRARISSLGGTPVAAEAAYRLPFRVGNREAAARLIGYLETRLAAPYADLVRAGTGQLRSYGAACLSQTAVAAASWTGTGSAFPGVTELSG